MRDARPQAGGREQLGVAAAGPADHEQAEPDDEDDAGEDHRRQPRDRGRRGEYVGRIEQSDREGDAVGELVVQRILDRGSHQEAREDDQHRDEAEIVGHCRSTTAPSEDREGRPLWPPRLHDGRADHDCA